MNTPTINKAHPLARGLTNAWIGGKPVAIAESPYWPGTYTIRSTDNAFTGVYPGAGTVVNSFFTAQSIAARAKRAAIPGGFAKNNGTIAGMGGK